MVVGEMRIAISDVIHELSDRLLSSTERPRSDQPRLQAVVTLISSAGRYGVNLWTRWDLALGKAVSASGVVPRDKGVPPCTPKHQQRNREKPSLA
jgi:hypothetical protein